MSAKLVSLKPCLYASFMAVSINRSRFSARACIFLTVSRLTHPVLDELHSDRGITKSRLRRSRTARGRTQMAQMTKRLAVKGSRHGLRRHGPESAPTNVTRHRRLPLGGSNSAQSEFRQASLPGCRLSLPVWNDVEAL